MPYSYVVSGLSDVGLVRDNNEDVWGEIEELSFFALADGMGGHQAGEVASREAISNLLSLIRQSFSSDKKERSIEDAVKAIKHAIVHVNQIVYKISRGNEQLKGMGTTLCSLLVHKDGAILAHVGDSRIYRLRQNKLEMMTKDHSLFRELVDLGQLSEGLLPEFAYKNIITKAIGTESRIEPTLLVTDVIDKDTYLLCTDGLTDLLNLKEIEEIVKLDRSVDEIVKLLIEVAKEKGGHDNITVVLVQIHEKKSLS